MHQCEACGHIEAEEDWYAPLMPLRIGACVNCSDTYTDNRCRGCGLTRDEVVQVHDELRQMVAPTHDLLNAAREASRAGRRLIALKLATAAAVFSEHGGDTARALRIWLLWDLGESQSALEEAEAWVTMGSDAPAIAWASLGQQQQHSGFPGEAAESYAQALLKDPNQHPLRARRAALLVDMGRFGQATEECIAVFESQVDDRTIDLAIQASERLADFYRSGYRDNEIERLLERAGSYVDRSAVLLAHRARLAALRRDISSARRDLRRARRMQPDLEIYTEIDQVISPSSGKGKRQSWWRW